MAAGETRQLPLEVTLPFDTVNGSADVRLDFDISAERRYQFSVYRTINIGLDDVTLEVTSRLNEQGELVVEQKLINKTEDPVSFRCSLFIPDRQRMITQVVDQHAGRCANVSAGPRQRTDRKNVVASGRRTYWPANAERSVSAQQ